MNKRTKTSFLFFFIFSLFCFFGCGEEDEFGILEKDSKKELREKIDALFRSKSDNDNVYIDSVPDGADVYLMKEDEKKKFLGKTPLVVKASECPGMTFWISMNMDYYLEKVKVIPEMREWIDGFKSDQYFYRNLGFSSEYFDFGVPVSISDQSSNGEIVSIGPKYKLDWPEENRICVFFIPKEKKISLFFPLMPPPGTFEPLKGKWPTILRERYHFSQEQAKEALACLTRCGKYRARIKDPFKKDKAKDISIIVQGGGKDVVVATMCEVSLIPGYNDTLFGY